MNVSIARDFSATPGGRLNRDGPASGQAFRERFLQPAVDDAKPVTISLEGVAGLPSSFLEEAFGGLFRARPRLTLADARRLITIDAGEADLRPYVELIQRYMREASEIAMAAA